MVFSPRNLALVLRSIPPPPSPQKTRGLRVVRGGFVNDCSPNLQYTWRRKKLCRASGFAVFGSVPWRVSRVQGFGVLPVFRVLGLFGAPCLPTGSLCFQIRVQAVLRAGPCVFGSGFRFRAFSNPFPKPQTPNPKPSTSLCPKYP